MQRYVLTKQSVIAKDLSFYLYHQHPRPCLKNCKNSFIVKFRNYRKEAYYHPPTITSKGCSSNGHNYHRSHHSSLLRRNSHQPLCLCLVDENTDSKDKSSPRSSQSRRYSSKTRVHFSSFSEASSQLQPEQHRQQQDEDSKDENNFGKGYVVADDDDIEIKDDDCDGDKNGPVFVKSSRSPPLPPPMPLLSPPQLPPRPIYSSQNDETIARGQILIPPLKQTKENTELLYDSLAPHLQDDHLKFLLKRIKRHGEMLDEELEARRLFLLGEDEGKDEDSNIMETSSRTMKYKNRRKRRKSTFSSTFLGRQDGNIQLISHLNDQIDMILGDDKSTNNNKKKKKKKKMKKNEKQQLATSPLSSILSLLLPPLSSSSTQSLSLLYLNTPWIKNLLGQFFDAVPILRTVSVKESNFEPTPVSTIDKAINVHGNNFNIASRKTDDSKIEPCHNLLSIENLKQELLGDQQHQQPMMIRQNAIWDDPTFPPNINQAMRKHYIDIVLKTREICLEHSPFLLSWNDITIPSSANQRNNEQQQQLEYIRSIHYAKSFQVLQNDAMDILTALCHRLPPHLLVEYMEVMELFVKDNVDDLIGNGDNGGNNRTLALMQLYNGDQMTASTKTRTAIVTPITTGIFPIQITPSAIKKRSTRRLFPHLRNCAGLHIHLVSQDVAKFFYAYISTIEQQHDKKHEEPIVLARNDWIKTREEAVEILLNAQNSFVEIQWMMFRESLLQQQKQNQPLKQQHQMQHQPQTKKAPPGRRPKYMQLNLECIILNNEKFERSNIVKSKSSLIVDNNTDRDALINELFEDEDNDELPQVEKIICIDNLPIDVTVQEIEDIYSRCGPIKSVQIYNLRPALDPGKLSMRERKERWKKHRSNTKGGERGSQIFSSGDRNSRREPPRTPVYAIIEFYDTEGYHKATDNALRVFGMVIRRHPSRSIPAYNLKSIYVENISSGIYPRDVEERLNSILHPDLFVCVDMKMGDGDYYNKQFHVNGEVASCEIKFPSFETANHAFQLLRDDMFLNNYQHYKIKQMSSEEENNEEHEIALNWMKTPDNATGYWTREITVDNSPSI